MSSVTLEFYDVTAFIPLKNFFIEKGCENFDQKLLEEFKQVCERELQNKAGMDITLISEWLGHSNVITTWEFYVKISIERKKAQLDKITPKEDEDYEPEYDFSDEELLKKLYELI